MSSQFKRMPILFLFFEGTEKDTQLIQGDIKLLRFIKIKEDRNTPALIPNGNYYPVHEKMALTDPDSHGIIKEIFNFILKARIM